MSEEQMLAQAQRNIKLIVLVNTLTKRTYLPLSAIYFVQVCGLSLLDIGYLAAFFALVLFLSDLPSGYLADRIGRARCIRVGAVLGMVSLLCFIFIQNKLGVFVGVAFEGIAYGFLTGAAPALVHDSLEVTKQEHLYSKILSRSQAISLVISACLTVLVPLTYPIDVRLPFGIGLLAFVGLLVSGVLMRDVRHGRPEKLRLPALRLALRKRTLLVFVAVMGLVAAVYWAPAELNKLVLNDLGVPPEHLGWFFTGASIVGALLGLVIHKLKNIPLPVYAALDALLAAVVLGAVFTNSLLIFGPAFVVAFGFWRYRRIIYQHHLLEIYPTRYKGVLFAIMNSSEELNTIWVSLIMGGLAAHYGLANGLGLAGAVSLSLLPIFVVISILIAKKRPQVGSLAE